MSVRAVMLNPDGSLVRVHSIADDLFFIWTSEDGTKTVWRRATIASGDGNNVIVYLEDGAECTNPVLAYKTALANRAPAYRDSQL